MDHIKPGSAGGTTDLDNLALACDSCNQYKHDFQSAVDPETTNEIALFNPRLDAWQDHFRWSSDGTEIIGLTATGRATIERLQMNHAQILAARRKWVSVDWHPPRIE